MGRRIPLGRRSLTGFQASRFGGRLAFESRLERDALVLFQFDPDVTRIATQSITIEYGPGPRRRVYTPDILIEWRPGAVPPFGKRAALVEIKYAAELEEHAEKLAVPFAAARDYCASQGMAFEVLTEDQIRTPLLAAAEVLLEHWLRTPQPLLVTAVLAAIEGIEHRTKLGALQERLVLDGWSFDAVYSALRHFLARRLIGADLRRPIDDDLAVWDAHEVRLHA